MKNPNTLYIMRNLHVPFYIEASLSYEPDPHHLIRLKSQECIHIHYIKTLTESSCEAQITPLTPSACSVPLLGLEVIWPQPDSPNMLSGSTGHPCGSSAGVKVLFQF